MEKIYLRDVLRLVWAARFFVLTSVLCSLLIAFVLLATTPAQYEATVTLVPTHANQYASQSGGSVQSLASSFGQVLGMGGDKDSQTTAQFVELMQSPYIIGLIDSRYHIISHIFASGWNSNTKRWVRPSGLSVAIKNAIKSLLHLPGWVPPGSFEASAVLKQRTTIETTPLTGMVHVSVRDKDPAYAVFLLDAMYRATDGLLRERAKQRSDENVAYIQRQLASVNYTENRQSLGMLLTAELSQQLLINSNAPFVLEKLTPIMQSPAPVSPKVSTYILIAILLGVLIGFGLSLIEGRYGVGEIVCMQWRQKMRRAGEGIPRAGLPYRDM